MKYWENMWRAVMLLAGWMPFMACAEVYFAQVTKVSDGDTVWVKPEGVAAPRKLRLQGLDAPEICQAWGQTDDLSKEIVADPVSVPDFFATLCAAVGVDYGKNLYDGDRPIPITDQGNPIASLFV